MPGYDEERVLLGVADAYGALAARLADSGGAYFFGNAPSSLDAIAFAHLAFHAHSPVGDAMR
jgi:glutathione S-transferase